MGYLFESRVKGYKAAKIADAINNHSDEVVSDILQIIKSAAFKRLPEISDEIGAHNYRETRMALLDIEDEKLSKIYRSVTSKWFFGAIYTTINGLGLVPDEYSSHDKIIAFAQRQRKIAQRIRADQERANQADAQKEQTSAGNDIPAEPEEVVEQDQDSIDPALPEDKPLPLVVHQTLSNPKPVEDPRNTTAMHTNPPEKRQGFITFAKRALVAIKEAFKKLIAKIINHMPNFPG